MTFLSCFQQSKGTHCWVREQIGQDRQGRGWQKRQRHNFPKARLGWILVHHYSSGFQSKIDCYLRHIRWLTMGLLHEALPAQCSMQASQHPSVLQQILAKDSHSHEDDIANGLWMTLARQICTCWTKIERRQSLINSNRTNPNNAALILPALLCRNCSSLFKGLSDPRKTSFLIHLKPSASVHGSTAPGSRQPKDYPAGPLCLW